MKIDIGCRGCFLYKICEMAASKYKDKCPCRECLIKVMCKNACGDYKLIRLEYFNVLNSEESNLYER